MSETSKQKWKTAFPLLFVFILFIVSASRIDTSQIANFSPAFVKPIFEGMSRPDWSFVYDGSGEDLVSLLLITLSIGFLGTLLGAIGAFPFMLLSSKNLWAKNHVMPKAGKFILDALRSVPELVYAIVFVKVVGPGPFAGVLAIGISQVGMLGKLFTEQMEAMPRDAVESMEAVGANFWQTMFFSRLPILLPAYASYTLNHFEIAVRSAATLGLVGAGGIGAPMIFAIQSRRWSRVSVILLGVILIVYVIDDITGRIRKRLK